MKPTCPHCNKEAEWTRTNKHSIRRIYCQRCAGYFTHAAAPRVLVFDIETSRMNVTAFQTGKQVIRHHMIQDDWYVICWSAKWLFGKETFGACVTPQEAKKRNDKRVIQELHNVLRQADFVVTHNGNRFDIKKVNWRFIYHRLKPVPHFGSIDTLSALKTIAAPSSFALDHLLKQLGYEQKLETEHGLWEGCEKGDATALNYMFEYNKGDVVKTEDIYLHIRPYMKSHPNFAAFLDMYQEVDKTLDVGKDNHRCPRCLKGIISKEKFRKNRQTPAGYFYKIANCPECGALVYAIRKDNSLRHSQKVYIR